MATIIELSTREAVHKRDHHHPDGEHCTDPVECIAFGPTLWFAVCHDCAEETRLTDQAHVRDYAQHHHCTH